MVTAQNKQISKTVLSIPDVYKKRISAPKDRHKTKRASSKSIDSILIAAKKRFAPTTHVYHEGVESTSNSKKNRATRGNRTPHARAKQTVIKEKLPN